MFKYYILKIRYFLACLLAVILICASVVVGGAVGLTNDRKDAINEYEGGFLSQGIKELLVYRADSTRQLIELFFEYLPEDGEQSAAAEEFISQVQKGADAMVLSVSQRAAEKAITGMVELLEEEHLPSSGQARLQNLMIQLEENHNEIIRSSYNQTAAQYNEAISKFPGDIYAKYLILEPLAQFE